MAAESPDTSAQVLLLLAQGQQIALRQLHEEWSGKLFKFALSIVHTRELAEEVVQDVFLQLWKNREQSREIRELKLYLYVATRNMAISHLRKSQKSKVFSLDEIKLPYLKVEASAEEVYLGTELLHRINLAINNLPLQCKLIFKLVKQDGFSYKEAAELLQINRKTVENQLGIAIKKIHAAVRLQDDADKKTSSG